MPKYEHNIAFYRDGCCAVSFKLIDSSSSKIVSSYSESGAYANIKGALKSAGYDSSSNWLAVCQGIYWDSSNSKWANVGGIYATSSRIYLKVWLTGTQQGPYHYEIPASCTAYRDVVREIEI